MSETTNLKLFKHDNPSTNTNQFDIEKSINENIDKIDTAVGINKEKIVEIEEKIKNMNSNSGGGTGEKGEDGATFIPTVSREGIISWTNNKGLENPTAVNIKGEQGIAGEDGIDGKSAYEIAVNNGFEGNEQEWIASLKGAKGEQGLKGDKGDKGEPGNSATYDDTELQTKITNIETNVGNISAVLDSINGEVI